MRKPSVTLVAGTAGHQKTLPEALARAGMARAVVRLGPDLEILEPGSDGELKTAHKLGVYRHGNRLLWALRRRVPKAWRQFVPMLGWSRLADRWIAARLPGADVFHGLMSMSLASAERAKLLGAAVLIDNPTLHPAVFQRELMIDGGDSERAMPPSAIRRCERQYEMCDRIIVYSGAAARSFQEFRYAGKTVVIRPGVDHVLFSPASSRTPGDVFRVCYVGRIEAPKGVQRLIEAWKRLAPADAELVLAGRVLPEMEYLLAEGPRMRIRLPGILRPEEVVRCYRESDLFVFPSVNEGLPLVVLEAMSCGLPVVACRGTGAEDCGTALLVPGRDAGALADAISWCYSHRIELQALGRAARERVEVEFTLRHYEDRLLELYRSVC